MPKTDDAVVAAAATPVADWNPRQVGNSACGYFALANAINELGGRRVSPEMLMKKNGRRINRLEFNEVLSNSGLGDQYHVVMPYDPVTSVGNLHVVIGAMTGDDTVFIGHYQAHIQGINASTDVAPKTDYHYAMLKRSSTLSEDKVWQAFTVKCSAAGKQCGVVAGYPEYFINGKGDQATQRIALHLMDVLAVRRGPDPTRTPKRSFLAWLKGKLCCCCRVEAAE